MNLTAWNRLRYTLWAPFYDSVARFGRQRLREAARVLKPGGRIAVFDKFLPDGERPRLPRRLANAFTRTLFIDINRRMGDILEGSGAPLRIEHDEPAMLGGTFRILLLRR